MLSAVGGVVLYPVARARLVECVHVACVGCFLSTAYASQAVQQSGGCSLPTTCSVWFLREIAPVLPSVQP